MNDASTVSALTAFQYVAYANAPCELFLYKVLSRYSDCLL